MKLRVAVLIVVGLGLGPRAYAEDPASVRLVPAGPGTDKLVASARFPAGASFFVEMPAPDTSTSAVIEVWPSEDCKAARTSDKQFYRRAMVASGDGAARVVRAKIPALQIGQRFCYRVGLSQGLPAAELLDVTARLQVFYVDELAARGELPAEPAVTAKVATLASGIAGSKGWDELQRRLQRALELAPALTEYRLRATELNASIKQAAEIARQVLDAYRAAAALAHRATCDSPTVLVGGKLRAAADLVGRGVAERAEASAALADRNKAPRQALDAPRDATWQQILELTDPRTRTTQSDKAKDAQPIQISMDGNYLDLHAEISALDPARGGSHIAARLDEVVAQLQTLGRCADKELVAALQAIPPLLAKQGQQATQLQEANAARNVAKQHVNEAIAAAVRDAAAYVHVDTALGLEVGAGDTDTPGVGSFVSPDFGMALAAPLAGGAKSPWFLPYFGVSFYLTKVDRDIPIDQLVGSRFRQVMSLTVGVSLAQPGIDGRTVDSIVFSQYPMVGINARLSEHVKLGAGAFFYLLHKQDPTNASRTFGVAPFVGISVDADVYHFIAKAYSEK